MHRHRSRCVGSAATRAGIPELQRSAECSGGRGKASQKLHSWLTIEWMVASVTRVGVANHGHEPWARLKFETGERGQWPTGRTMAGLRRSGLSSNPIDLIFNLSYGATKCQPGMQMMRCLCLGAISSASADALKRGPRQESLHGFLRSTGRVSTLHRGCETPMHRQVIHMIRCADSAR